MSIWHPQNVRWLILSVAIIFIDQLAKWEVTRVLQPYAPVPVFSWLNMMLAFNTGTVFSLFSEAPGWVNWVLCGIAIVVGGYLVVLIMDAEPYQRWTLLSYSLILGGAISNLLDRLWKGYVTDFIDFHIGTWHFATFNIADAAITVGAVILAVVVLLRKE